MVKHTLRLTVTITLTDEVEAVTAEHLKAVGEAVKADINNLEEQLVEAVLESLDQSDSEFEGAIRVQCE